MVPPIKQFEHLKITLEAIKSATNNFTDENCIGRGGFGKVYKGEIDNTMVALKRLNRYCDDYGEKILIYEYLPKKSLDRYLKSSELTWVRRLKICIGAARGLAFLHNPEGTHTTRKNAFDKVLPTNSSNFPKGICLERIGNDCYIEMVARTDGSNLTFFLVSQDSRNGFWSSLAIHELNPCVLKICCTCLLLEEMKGQGHAEYAGLDDVVGDNRLLDYSYAVVWDMSFQVVAAMFDKLGLTASRAEPQLQHPGKHPDTGRALFMS
ncbi:protein kinase, ATP binding site-containing protein [Tanacetum coccineum]